MEYIKEITLDVYQDRIVEVEAKQGDTARGVEITVTANGAQLIPAGSPRVCFRARKPDGHGIDNPAEITDRNTIKYKFTEQTVACPGRFPCDVYFVQEDGILATVTFWLIVHHAPVGDEGTSTYEYGAMIEATDKALDAAEAASGAAGAAGAATEAATQAAQAANTAAGAANDAAGKATEAADAATTAAGAANTAAGAANTAAGAANTAAQAATDAATKANTAATAADTAAGKANTAATAADTAAGKANTAAADATTAAGAANDAAKAATDAADAATGAAGEADAATDAALDAAERANAAAQIVEEGLTTILIDDQDDAKTWAASFVIKSGHLVLVADEKTA